MTRVFDGRLVKESHAVEYARDWAHNGHVRRLRRPTGSTAPRRFRGRAYPVGFGERKILSSLGLGLPGGSVISVRRNAGLQNFL